MPSASTVLPGDILPVPTPWPLAALRTMRDASTGLESETW
jgi:hypothetical protein